MKNPITLSAPEGATSLSFAGDTYDVVDGRVEVPHEAVEQLIGGHGFALYVEPVVVETPEMIEAARVEAEKKAKADAKATKKSGGTTGDTSVPTLPPAAGAETPPTGGIAAPWAK